MTSRSVLFERWHRALHPLSVPPSGPGWNFSDLADILSDADLRPAAVLVPLIERDDGVHVLLTRRTEVLRHHAGQVSFPGGRIEVTDHDPVCAALREAQEEVGLPMALCEPLGYLDPFVTITRFHVYPVVARVQASFTPCIDPSEVAEVFEVPLSFLLDPVNAQPRSVVFQGRQRPMLEFNYGKHRIWGATAAMLVNFRERLEQTQ